MCVVRKSDEKGQGPAVAPRSLKVRGQTCGRVTFTLNRHTRQEKLYVAHSFELQVVASAVWLFDRM